MMPAVLLAGCGTTVAPGAEPDDRDWRWESYAGIELQVPADYGWRSSGSPLYPAWCAATSDGGPPQAGVNRSFSAVMPAIMCPPDRPDDTYAPSVDLGARADGSPVDHGGGWVSETVDVAGVPVTVSDDDAARRQRIIASVREVDDVDTHGCPPDSVLRAPGARPATGPLPPADEVAAVAICRYALPTGFSDLAGRPEPILSSSRVDAQQARQLVDAVHAAPRGEGPNSPANCAEEVMFGEEIVVLSFATAGGGREVTLRFSGCDGHGIDDGDVVRRLTGEVLVPVLAGPHEPTSLNARVASLLN